MDLVCFHSFFSNSIGGKTEQEKIDIAIAEAAIKDMRTAMSRVCYNDDYVIVFFLFSSPHFKGEAPSRIYRNLREKPSDIVEGT